MWEHFGLNLELYCKATANMIQKQDRINNEFYVDSVINHVPDLGKKATIITVDRYLCWGTPVTQYEAHQQTARTGQHFKRQFLKKQNKLKPAELALIIPSYNEADNLLSLEKSLSTTFSNTDNIEIIIVDNGSTDHTKQTLTSVIKNSSLKQLKSVHVSENKGYGHGILAGLAAANANVLAWTHADLQTDPKDVLTAFNLYNKNNPITLVKGKRKTSIIRYFFTKGCNGMRR